MNRKVPHTVMEKGWGVIECPEFDLDLTLNSGQTFHWIPQEKGFAGCIGDIPYLLRQEGSLLHYCGGDAETLRHYFALDHDLSAIRASCAGHPSSRIAAEACRGLRIMRQPHWECLASFILSPMKQVAHIRQMSVALRTTYGRKLPGTSVPAFPEPAALAKASEGGLRRCGLGFRAKGLLGTAQRIASGEFDPETLSLMSTEDARKALCTLPGIGRKVANCILLFAYERLEAVPVDVWIGRILDSFRPNSSRKSKATPEELERYGERLLGPYAGYIQQYLFHQARTGNLKLPGKRKTAKGRPSVPASLSRTSEGSRRHLPPK
jgi:N-glycosylase/DNA lyase